MNIFFIFLNFLYRIRWWLILGVIFVTSSVVILTKDRIKKVYTVDSTIYTGVLSDINLSEASNNNSGSANNTMDNLLNILVSKVTLNNLSLRLFAQNMMYGDPNKDNVFITAANYRELYASVPQDVRNLIDKSSEEITFNNLKNYGDASYDNYIYKLFNDDNVFYSYDALKKIYVRRLASSDMIDVKYESTDPGIAYNTLLLLIDEFSKQYSLIRYGETDNVIKYFEEELSLAKKKLNISEDSLTNYSVDNKVINYSEQSKNVAALGRDYELLYEQILLSNDGSKKQMELLEKRIGEYTKRAKSSSLFLNETDKLSSINNAISQLEIFGNKETSSYNKLLDSLKNERSILEKEFMKFSKGFAVSQYSSEGISNLSFIEQWLNASIQYERSLAELKVLEYRKVQLDDKLANLSPVGTTIKRLEREISFNESTYLSILHGLNNATLRKKNLQLSSTSLNVINPPIYPLIAKPTKRNIIIAASFLGTIIFIIGIFLLIELIDRTIRDKRRAESMVKIKFIGALPAPQKNKYRAYNNEWNEIAEKYLANSLYSYKKLGKHLVVTIFGVDDNNIPNDLAKKLYSYWNYLGFNVKLAIPGEDYFIESKDYTVATKLSDIVDYDGFDIVIVVIPSVNKFYIPQFFISESDVSLLTVSANKVWTESDHLLLEKIKQISNGVPVVGCIYMASVECVETFTGLLPPYTKFRKRRYRMLQLGITSN